MKYVDEFRDPVKATALLEQIQQMAEDIMAQRSQPLQLMEFCGGHTRTIFRYGLEQLLPDSIELVHGPGCPVCVLPVGRVDDCVVLAERPEVIFTTFGDAMRVPGSRKSLLQSKAKGADVRMVYSPMDALNLARNNPHRQVVFFGLGFETTMPSTALTVLQTASEGIDNFSLFCNHITTVPTIKAILDSPDMKIDGFLAPGHVSMVVGEALAHHRAPTLRWRLYAIGAKVVKTGRQLFVKLKENHRALLEQVLIALKEFEPPPI
jgi:hydrogenase expression/formation protein HypD